MKPVAFVSVLTFLAVTSTVAGFAGASRPPNIVFVLTDDQDVVVDGMASIKKTKQLIGDQGITFPNMFVTSPLCCPSRSSILTGHYVHNHGAYNNSIYGNCSSPAWQQTMETRAFVTYLKKQNYNTFFAGKYLNQYGFRKTGGVEHIPPGWDEWNGLVGNSRYYNYSLSVNGKKEVHGDKYPEDYLTDIIGKRGLTFLKQQKTDGNPFFMMLSTPAAHAPFTPAPQYKNELANMTVPRRGSYNKPGTGKHWLISIAPNPMSQGSVEYCDKTFRDRLRTLMSVDDIVENLVTTLTEKKMLDNTYIIFTSDNGFHLGQFSLPNDKRQLYEFDIRVPLMVRGPGIKAGQVRKEAILNIDLAPTFIDLAGLVPPQDVDGQSFKEVLLSKETMVDKWRKDFLVEHWGEENMQPPACPQWNYQRMSNCFPFCICEDSWNNTYLCVRTLTSEENTMYCEMADNEGFVEFYDMNRDPDQLDNLALRMDAEDLQYYRTRLQQIAKCVGPECWTQPMRSVNPNKLQEQQRSSNDLLELLKMSQM